MTNHHKLRELAKAATPGPYLVASIGPSSYALWVHDGPASHLVANRLTKPDAEFIAEASPRVVLDLLAENERLLYENRALYAEQPKMQRDAWGEGYADGRDDTLEGVPGATSNPYGEEA